ncbi:MAG: symporter small accessory protein [Parabacteroides sp.]
MFGIDDILIILPYLLGIACVIFSAWYGIRNWNKD